VRKFALLFLALAYITLQKFAFLTSPFNLVNRLILIPTNTCINTLSGENITYYFTVHKSSLRPPAANTSCACWLLLHNAPSATGLSLTPSLAVSFSYDLLFGITESESYHTLAALALEEGLRENERDNLLRFYMQSRFDIRPDLALAATLKK